LTGDVENYIEFINSIIINLPDVMEVWEQTSGNGVSRRYMYLRGVKQVGRLHREVKYGSVQWSQQIT
jgi:hypothetical protein